MQGRARSTHDHAGARTRANEGSLRLGLGPLCFYIYVIMLLSIMLSEITILERDYATYMLA